MQTSIEFGTNHGAKEDLQESDQLLNQRCETGNTILNKKYKIVDATAFTYERNNSSSSWFYVISNESMQSKTINHDPIFYFISEDLCFFKGGMCQLKVK